MARFRKILAIMLTIVMAASLSGIGALAAGNGQTEITVHMSAAITDKIISVKVNGTDYTAKTNGSHFTIETNTTDNIFDGCTLENPTVIDYTAESGTTGQISVTPKEGNNSTEQDQGLNNYNGTFVTEQDGGDEPNPDVPVVTKHDVTINIYTKDLGDADYALVGTMTKALMDSEVSAFVGSKLNSYEFSGVSFFDRKGSSTRYTLSNPSYVGITVNSKEYGIEDAGSTKGLTAASLSNTINKNGSATLNYYFAQIVHYSVDYGYDTSKTNVSDINNIFTSNTNAGVTIYKTLENTSEYTFNGWKLNGGDYTVSGDVSDTNKINGFSQENSADAATETAGEINQVWFRFVSQWAAVGTEPTPTVNYTLTVNHVDASGNTVATGSADTYTAGSPYTTSAVTVAGYTFDHIDTAKDAASGTMDSDKTVVYIYTVDTVIDDEHTPFTPVPNTNPTPDVDIADDDTPLAPEPDVDISEEDTPLASTPDTGDGEMEIADEDVALDSSPKTGDNSESLMLLWSIFVISTSGLAVMMLTNKKSKKSGK